VIWRCFMLWVLVRVPCVWGAEPSSHWAFKPVLDPAPPIVKQGSWCRTPLDRFVLASMESRGVTPAAETQRRVWLRRVAFDLTGLPPTADEADAFESDPAEDAYERAVDRLLGSPAYGEKWGRHWLDVVRYADTAGETADYPVPVAWRYRDYVIASFNHDKPYDEFIREQVAGDILARSGPPERYRERVTATGFLAVSRRFGFDSENYHHLTLQDTIDTVGQGVLGLTLGCARCHAHKYDPVPLADYYALYGIFESTRFPFPGSEQKQRHRALTPTVPVSESAPRWREFEVRVAQLTRRLEQLKKSAPSAVLRSLDDMDGDFEMQAPASGGSKGVLVAPWIYEGPIAVTTDAQSPFRNGHPTGRVGASIPAGKASWRIAQEIPPGLRSVPGFQKRFFVLFDVRSGVEAETGQAEQGLVLEPAQGRPWARVLIGSQSVRLADGAPVTLPKPGGWNQVCLEVDRERRQISGTVSIPGDVRSLGTVALGVESALDIPWLSLGSFGGERTHASLALDNVCVQEKPFPPVTTDAPAPIAGRGDPEAVAREMAEWMGIDGDFELQRDHQAPESPWGPGPNSQVRIEPGAQSSWKNLFPAGLRGIRLPGGGAYNGFGQTLPRRWETAKTPRLHGAFDFRPASGAESGTWRFYLGHGAGGSAAVELHFNGTTFHARHGDERVKVGPVTAGQWHQVRYELDLVARRYRGVLLTPGGRHEFEGAVAAGWDGQIDYTFIDSYGHVNGVRCELDADNFVVGEKPLGAVDAVAGAVAEAGDRRARIAELKAKQAGFDAEAAEVRRELETLLVEGPVELAYAVSEGTPRDSRIQLRGDPDQPGDTVRRGFPRVLGGRPLPENLEGSGRLELAQWLTDPGNPLTARVMVNRIWQYHFGTGLVATPNDFGLRGQKPLDPALLDYLASRFVASGWSVKTMHRLIVCSATYRQASRGMERMEAPRVAMSDDCPVVGADSGVRSGQAEDGGWTPFNRRRLTAEELRDAILEASGGLDHAAGAGHPFPTPTSWGFTQHGPFGAVYGHERRSVYLMTQRIQRHPFLALFDGADPNASTAGRRMTTVPTQALYFLNDPFVHAAAARLARRATAAAPDDAGRVVAVYRSVLGRSPDAGEQEDARQLLTECRQRGVEGDPLAVLARVLFSGNEFLTVD